MRNVSRAVGVPGRRFHWLERGSLSLPCDPVPIGRAVLEVLRDGRSPLVASFSFSRCCFVLSGFCLRFPEPECSLRGLAFEPPPTFL